MVTAVSHGGQCCGSHHLYSFDSILTGDENLDEVNRELSQNVFIGRRVEVVLNRRQVTSDTSPALLRRLADLGFVLVEHYMNRNHDPARDNYVFTRCDTRRSLTDLPFEWTGQIINAGLTGDLPRVEVLPARAPNGGIRFAPVDPNLPMEFEDGTPAILVRTAGIRIYVRAALEPRSIGGRPVGVGWRDGSGYYRSTTGGYAGAENARLVIRNVAQFRVGDRVEVINQNSEHHGRIGRVNVAANLFVEIQPDRGSVFYVRKTFCTLVEQPGEVRPAPEPAADALPPHRHQQEDIAGLPALVEARAVYSTFHNRYQDGRIGAGYTTLEDAQQAAPRCLQRIRRDVSSDGTVTDVEL